MSDKAEHLLSQVEKVAKGSSNEQLIDKNKSNNKSGMSSKVTYLDGLRGVACFIVMMDHWFMMGYDDNTSHSTSVLWEPWLLRSPLRLLIDGGFAVAVFLTLSGYVLLIKFFTPPNETRTDLIYAGMVKRYPRLMIPALVSMFMYYSWLHFGPYQGYSGCHAVGEITNDIVHFGGSNYTISFTAGDLVLNGIIGQWTYEPAIYTVQWTLQIELICSIVIFLAALFIVKLRPGHTKTGVYVFLCLFIPVITEIVHVLPLEYFQSFIMGKNISDFWPSEANCALFLRRNVSCRHGPAVWHDQSDSRFA
jgi:peptidoglycan/LPS O-acetylase OafA/YrhL